MTWNLSLYAVDTGRKLNVHKMFRRRPGRLLNVLCTFNLRPVSTGIPLFVIAFHISSLWSETFFFTHFATLGPSLEEQPLDYLTFNLKVTESCMVRIGPRVQPNHVAQLNILIHGLILSFSGFTTTLMIKIL